MKLPVSRRLVLPTVAAVAVVGGGSAILMRHGASGSTQYRTALATLGTVTQTLNLSGNLSPVGETDLDFGSSGRVTAVDVQPGQTVTAGQVLATIDPTSVQAALTQAQATLSSAQSKLSLDQGGPTVQSLSQSQASVRTAQAQVQSAQTALTDTERIDQSSITSAQDALNAAQNKLSADEGNQCKAPTPTPSPAPSASPSPSTCATPQQISGDEAAVSSDKDGLSSAQAKGQQSDHQAQSQLSSAQVQLQNAQAALTALQQGSSTQQVQMDQAQIQIDQINVTNAQNALSQATLTAPVPGVVGQVNITVGQTAGSGASSGGSGSSSASHAIVVLNPGAFEVVGTVSDAQVNEIALGQRAQVTVAGSSQAITGKVTTIAPEATVSSGVATFPVTVVLDGINPSLHSGVSASIAVVVNQVVHVLTVPSSAIRGTTVQTLVNGQPQTVPVTVGASDALRTQILSGLNEGDTVVIATVSSVVPTPSAGSFLGGGGGGGGGRGGTGGAGRGGAGGAGRAAGG